jgi:hypothetical protein
MDIFAEKGFLAGVSGAPRRLFVQFTNHEVVVRRNDDTGVACELDRRRGLHQAWPGGPCTRRVPSQ